MTQKSKATHAEDAAIEVAEAAEGEVAKAEDSFLSVPRRKLVKLDQQQNPSNRPKLPAGHVERRGTDQALALQNLLHLPHPPNCKDISQTLLNKLKSISLRLRTFTRQTKNRFPPLPETPTRLQQSWSLVRTTYLQRLSCWTPNLQIILCQTLTSWQIS